jgi:hypothetical protein
MEEPGSGLVINFLAGSRFAQNELGSEILLDITGPLFEISNPYNSSGSRRAKKCTRVPLGWDAPGT